uniref:Peptidase S8/S53 domain-containing protein n=1 Tax=Populus trichocarpa TaxID=3694 RepID=A0A3N7GBW6_POPTR
MDIMAAFDDAIQDGADMISLSVGGPVSDSFNDAIAIGSFHAMKKGILTSCAAGNEGPALASVGNVAPWILTVGASGMDRQFRTPLTIGNSIKTSGISVNTFTPKARMYPLTSAAQAWNDSVQMPDAAGYCFVETLDKNKVKGKIVLCKGGSDSDIKEMGGVGMIVASDDSLDTGFTLVLPAAIVNSERGA